MTTTHIARYEIIRELGRGGMAIVYLGRDPQVGREVAIKVLPAQFSQDEAFRQRFAREARTVAQLEHPSIVPLYDFGEENGQLYFVMRHMQGGTLTDKIEHHGFSMKEITNVLRRVGEALDYAHSQGVIHRDLKPGNILFDQLGQPYLSDFGIARGSNTSNNLTGAMIIGTPGYMSPEQAQGNKQLDGRSDLYALGVIVFQMLAGRLPYEASTPMATAIKHITEPVPNILRYNPNLPAPAKTFVERALAKDPGARYPSAKALMQAFSGLTDNPAVSTQDLSTLIEPIPTAASITPPPTAPRPAPAAPSSAPAKPRRRIWPLVLTVLLIGLLTVAGGLGYLWSTGNPQLLALLNSAPVTNTPTTDQLVATAEQRAQEQSPDEDAIAIAVTQTQAVALSTEIAATEEAGLSLTATAELNNSIEQAVQATAVQATADYENSQAFIAASTATAEAEVFNATATADAISAEATAAVANSVDAYLSAPKIAFIRNSDIWIVNTDGTELKQMTTNGTTKRSLRWLDAQTLTFVDGLCVTALDILSSTETNFGCLTSSTEVTAFEVSPNKDLFAFAAGSKLFLGTFDTDVLGSIVKWNDLEATANCFTYENARVKDVRWSSDGSRMAVKAGIPWNVEFENADGVTETGTVTAEIIKMINADCSVANPVKTDEFPAQRFELPNYSNSGYEIVHYGWDGDELFSLTDPQRNGGFGQVYIYNQTTAKQPLKANALGAGQCCYRDLSWNDGNTTAVFAYQNINEAPDGEIGLYTISASAIYDGGATQIPLPEDFFTDLKDQPQPVFAPTP